MSGRASGESGAGWGAAALIAGAGCIGFAAILVKLSPLGPQATAFWRLVIALPALAIWASLERAASRGDGPTARATPPWRLLLLCGVFFAGDLATWHAGIVRTSAANATFLANLTPVVVLAWTWIAGRRRPDGGFLAAVALALAGSLAMSGGAPGQDPERLMGDALSAATSLWYAAYLIALTRARETTGAGLAMLVSTAAAAPLALVAALATGETIAPPLQADGFLWGLWPLLAIGLLVHVGGQGLMAFGMGRTPVAVSSVIILFQPVVAGFAGWLVLGERLGPVQIGGAGLVLLGVWLARRAR
jgi:drug/metabolite transporter (DMT)-like permease